MTACTERKVLTDVVGRHAAAIRRHDHARRYSDPNRQRLVRPLGEADVRFEAHRHTNDM